MEDVKAAADKFVQPDNMVWVVVGDREKIEDDVRALEFGELMFLDEDGNPVDAGN
ncbi:MAG: hypothetical protein P8X98_16600 [Woeseiaceae bacterium]